MKKCNLTYEAIELANGQGLIACRCETHNLKCCVSSAAWYRGESFRCPIGQIEDATEAAKEEIKEWFQSLLTAKHDSIEAIMARIDAGLAALSSALISVKRSLDH